MARARGAPRGPSIQLMRGPSGSSGAFAVGRLSRQAWPQLIFEEPLTPLRAPARDRAEDPALPVSVAGLRLTRRLLGSTTISCIVSRTRLYSNSACECDVPEPRRAVMAQAEKLSGRPPAAVSHSETSSLERELRYGKSSNGNCGRSRAHDRRRRRDHACKRPAEEPFRGSRS